MQLKKKYYYFSRAKRRKKTQVYIAIMHVRICCSTWMQIIRIKINHLNHRVQHLHFNRVEIFIFNAYHKMITVFDLNKHKYLPMWAVKRYTCNWRKFICSKYERCYGRKLICTEIYQGNENYFPRCPICAVIWCGAC